MKLFIATLYFASCVFSASAQEEAPVENVAATEQTETTAEGAGTGTEVEEKLQPTSEWGTYYNLPNERDFYAQAFKKVFTAEVEVGGKSECSFDDASFQRWYKNIREGEKETYILSYFCLSSKGYEHLKVKIPEGNAEGAVLLQYADKLSQLNVIGAKAYPKEKKTGAEADKVYNRLLEAIKPAFAEVKVGDKEVCKNPGGKTSKYIKQKEENELNYTELPVSCENESGQADEMVVVEVAEDNKYKSINDGKPILAVVGKPKYQYLYYEELDNAEKQKGSGNVFGASFCSFLVMMILNYLF